MFRIYIVSSPRCLMSQNHVDNEFKISNISLLKSSPTRIALGSQCTRPSITYYINLHVSCLGSKDTNGNKIHRYAQTIQIALWVDRSNFPIVNKLINVIRDLCYRIDQSRRAQNISIIKKIFV